jgi:16S rRNA (guanine527-N7)-methyltransferase
MTMQPRLARGFATSHPPHRTPHIALYPSLYTHRSMSNATHAASPPPQQAHHPLAEGLSQGLKALGLLLSPAQERQLLDYVDLIQKWNKVYNLTAVRDPAEMLTHHLLDSLAVVAPLRHHTQGLPARVLDVGSGAGLPGTVLAIVCPELAVICVDTVGKKAAFIQQTAVTLKLPNLQGVHTRVEELKAEPFDVVTSRAFSSLVDFVALTRFHVKQAVTGNAATQVGEGAGVWMAMKGKHPADELAALPKDVAMFHVEPLDVPGLAAERCLVWMRVLTARDSTG